MPSKKCFQCKRSIEGRRDKKFCSDECRTKYHNDLNADVSKFMNRINSMLRKNRRILAKFNPKGKSKVSRTELLDEGFKFAYFTNEYVTKAGKVYRFCYEQGYLELDNDMYALVHRKKYVD